MQALKRTEQKLSDILETIKNRGNPDDVHEMYRIGENFDLYRKPSNEPLTKDMACYIDDSVTGNDNNGDVYPEFIESNGLEFCYSGERFIDVVLSVFDQTENPGIDDFVEALNYYAENDDFL